MIEEVVGTEDISFYCKDCGMFLGTLKDLLLRMIDNTLTPPPQQSEIVSWVPGSFIHALAHTHVDCKCLEAFGELDLILDRADDLKVIYEPQSLKGSTNNE